MEKPKLTATQEHRRERLQALATETGGYAALGRLIGYRDGAYVAQLCKGVRATPESVVEACEALPGYRGWFHQHGVDSGIFSQELITTLRKLDPENIKRMENLLRSALAMPLIR